MSFESSKTVHDEFYETVHNQWSLMMAIYILLRVFPNCAVKTSNKYIVILAIQVQNAQEHLRMILQFQINSEKILGRVTS